MNVREKSGFYEKIAEYLDGAKTPAEIAKALGRAFPGTTPVTASHVSTWLRTPSFWQKLIDTVGREKAEVRFNKEQSRQRLQASINGQDFTPTTLEQFLTPVAVVPFRPRLPWAHGQHAYLDASDLGHSDRGTRLLGRDARAVHGARRQTSDSLDLISKESPRPTGRGLSCVILSCRVSTTPHAGLRMPTRGNEVTPETVFCESGNDADAHGYRSLREAGAATLTGDDMQPRAKQPSAE